MTPENISITVSQNIFRPKKRVTNEMSHVGYDAMIIMITEHEFIFEQASSRGGDVESGEYDYTE